MTTALQTDPERDGVAAVGALLDRKVRRGVHGGRLGKPPKTQAKILLTLAEFRAPMKTAEVAVVLDVSVTSVDQAMRKLLDAGIVEKCGYARYRIAAPNVRAKPARRAGSA